MTTVSVARPEDWVRVRALRLAALAQAPDAFSSSLTEEQARPETWWQDRLGAGATTLLATLAETLVGLAVVGEAWDGPPDHLGLYAVWVDPGARRAGVGQALVQAAVAEATGRGATCLRLEVGVENAPANALYLRAGFVPTGRTSRMPPPRRHVIERELALALPGRPAPRSGF